VALFKVCYGQLLKQEAMKRKIINPLYKDTVTFVKTSAISDGKISELEITLLSGGKNPIHYHKSYSETFTAIDGDLGLGLGKGKRKILKPGNTYTVDPNNLHYFFNPNDKEIKFKSVLKPGHEGFENSLRILYGMASDGLTDKNGIPKSIQHKAIVAIMADMNIPGFFTLIFPLLKRIARKAKNSGVEQELIDRYCK
jgi:quercetin dioxygenase-like cupin family protein